MNNRPRPTLAAGVVFLDPSNRVLLVHQTYARLAWSLPGGILEPGEAAHDSALREVREEIGVDATIDHVVGVYFDPQRNVMMFAFAGELPDGKEPVITDHDELDDIGWFSMDGLPSPMRTSLPYVLDDVAADRRGVSRTIPFT